MSQENVRNTKLTKEGKIKINFGADSFLCGKTTQPSNDMEMIVSRIDECENLFLSAPVNESPRSPFTSQMVYCQ